MRLFLVYILLVLTGTQVHAETVRHATVLGPLGLSITPNARMDEPGTVRAGIGTLDPYLHAAIGLQIARPLYISMRQTAETSDLNNDARALYPGIDIKVRLLEEGAYSPEISVGWLGAIGHKRMAGEYLVASKRFENWDVSAGMGWGRYGSAHDIGNPLRLFGDHFKKQRGLDGMDPNGPQDWFTDADVGLFAGLEYATPWVEGLSLSAEWGADRYLAEKAAFDFDAPAPWALGVHYSPTPWASFSTALVGGEKIMASLTFQNALSKWPGKLFKRDKQMHEPLRPYRTGLTLPAEMELSAERSDITLHDTKANYTRAQAQLEIPATHSTPRTISLALPHMNNHAGETVEALEIQPTHAGLKGPLIRLNRRDITQALGHHTGSPQEIWRNVEFNLTDTDDMTLSSRTKNTYDLGLRLMLDEQVSLSEEDNGILHRSSLVLDSTSSSAYGLLGGMGLRLNLGDNLGHLRTYRLAAPLPVRSNVADFAENRIGLERMYGGIARTLAPDIHVAAAAGYLEEMYAGFGGDILYRPFRSTWAIGAEGWLALKRDPNAPLNMGLNGDRVFTGHLKAYYEFPETDMTAEARLGRYLNEDIGGTLALNQRFGHGLNVRGFVTATDQADVDIFGGTTNLYAGLELTMPLGNIPFIPQNTVARVKAAPFGRDTGQTLESPIDLYAMTEPLSYRHLTQYWNDVVE